MSLRKVIPRVAIANQPRERIARRRVNVLRLSDGNERRQRVTDDGQPQRGEELVRTRRQFKRQLE